MYRAIALEKISAGSRHDRSATKAIWNLCFIRCCFVKNYTCVIWNCNAEQDDDACFSFPQQRQASIDNLFKLEDNADVQGRDLVQTGTGVLLRFQ